MGKELKFVVFEGWVVLCDRSVRGGRRSFLEIEIGVGRRWIE